MEEVKQVIEGKAGSWKAAVEHFSAEAAKLRTGRANAGLVEDMMVDYYGVKTPLKQMASITVPEARLIAIAPWDRDAIVSVEAAIRESDLGLNPMNDGLVVRLSLPMLTEDRRKELVKALGNRMEDAKQSVRSIREDAWKDIQEMEKRGEIGEDDKFFGKDELQKEVDRWNAELEAIRKKKEEDILTV
jgi:ribosome recycling factor